MSGLVRWGGGSGDKRGVTPDPTCLLTGNILLNIIVQASMPCSRLGKNNVMVVCVPNPPVDDKNPSSPVPLLIRVKTTEDADELHKILEEKKG